MNKVGMLVAAMLFVVSAHTRGVKRFCPICEKQQKHSKVYRGLCTSTSLYCGSGHWDESGEYHAPPECNQTTCSYSCSNGHEWTEPLND